MASKPTKYQLDILKKMSKGVDVNKALTTGYDIDPETMTGGSVLLIGTIKYQPPFLVCLALGLLAK